MSILPAPQAQPVTVYVTSRGGALQVTAASPNTTVIQQPPSGQQSQQPIAQQSAEHVLPAGPEG
mgnify:CR=1 FL=1